MYYVIEQWQLEAEKWGEKLGEKRGEKLGKERERRRGIAILASACKNMGVPVETAVRQLKSKYRLTREEALDALAAN